LSNLRVEKAGWNTWAFRLFRLYKRTLPGDAEAGIKKIKKSLLISIPIMVFNF
jgi:hypothetical protein